MVEGIGKGNSRTTQTFLGVRHANRTSAGEATSRAGTWPCFRQMWKTRVLLLPDKICVVNTPGIMLRVHSFMHLAGRGKINQIWNASAVLILGRFPKVRTDRPDHSLTSHFDNEKCFFPRVLLKHHLLLAGYF